MVCIWYTIHHRHGPFKVTRIGLAHSPTPFERLENDTRAMPKAAENLAEGPWNPGIGSTIPRKFLHLSTVFRPENVSTSIAEADDLADFTGLAAKDLVTFRLERLVVHEVLIRIMADVSVPDGSHYGDLGINFRDYSDRVLSNHIIPEMPKISAEFDQLLREIDLFADRKLAGQETTKLQRPTTWWQKLTGSAENHSSITTQSHRSDRLARWGHDLAQAKDPLEQSVLQALLRAGTAISAKHGRLIGDDDLLRKIAVTLAVNGYGSKRVGELIAPLVKDGIRQEGLRPLPIQSKPVIMNVKGASAAGKSTRPR